jgi:hypothetical protein
VSNSLRHVSPAILADLEDDLEKQAEMEYIAAIDIGAKDDHHQLHDPQGGDCGLASAR